MTVMEFFGCTFIAFGPPFALFVFTIARDPLRIIVLIARYSKAVVSLKIFFKIDFINVFEYFRLLFIIWS